jgi:hypothetical protein
MAAVVEFAVTITDVLGGAVGPLAFARDSLERAVSAALPGGAPMLQGLHVRGAGSAGGAAESALRQTTELRKEDGSRPVGVIAPTPDSAELPVHTAEVVVVQVDRHSLGCEGPSIAEPCSVRAVQRMRPKLFIYPSIHLSIYPSIHPSFHLSIHSSIVQATADGAATMHALRSAVLSGEFGL